jgi:hypothetical protein
MTTTKTTKPRAKTAPAAGEVTLTLSPDGPFEGFGAADELLAYATEAHRNFPAEAPTFIDWGLYDAFEAEVRARLNAAYSEVRGGYERAVAAQPSAAEMYARAHIPVPASSLARCDDAPPAGPPRHAAPCVSLPLLHRTLAGLRAMSDGEGPAYPAGAVTAEAAAPLAPLPQRIPGATQSAPPLGASSGDPEWRTLPARTERAFTPRQSVPWDGAPTTVKLIRALPVAAAEETEPAETGQWRRDIEAQLGGEAGVSNETGPHAAQAAHDAGEAPDFPADPAHEERQDDEALDEAANPIPVGDWQEIRTEEEAAG